jgi:hypothetical protein
MAGHRAASILYWAGAVVLVAFGAVAIFSIGAPFFLTGLAMLAVGPRRRERAVVWPVLLGVWAFVLGYVLIAPLGCTTSGSAHVAAGSSLSHTSCTNLLGLNYSGEGVYNPPLLPAFLAGLALCAIVAFVSRQALRARGA